MTALQQQIARRNYKQINHDLETGSEYDPLPSRTAKSGSVNKLMRIASVLQTTLVVRNVIELFVNEINGSPYFDNVVYTHQARNIELSIGIPEIHAASYRLVVANEALGEITFSRSKRFSNREVAMLEQYLGSLVFPLRNALAYEWALQAALKDPMTGVYNRTSLDSTLGREIDLARRHQTQLSMIMVDVDHFKRINDLYGHAAGDAVLIHVASSLQRSMRSTDMVFRFGGEEFLILLSNTDGEGALLLAERLRNQIETILARYNHQSILVTASFGVTSLNKQDSEHTLFERADQALYAAKAAGRNCIRSLSV